MEGIFPRSYVNVIEEKAAQVPPSSYGNMPLEVSQGGPVATTEEEKKHGKFEEHGKKFGKKLGNAGTFSQLTYTCAWPTPWVYTDNRSL
jgi:hypothetical protein